MRFPQVAIGEISNVNPKGPARGEIGADEALNFIPMAAVSEKGHMDHSESRPYSDVSKGFTAFQRHDVLVAKITPCYENNKIAKATIDTNYGFGSTEFHVIRANAGELDPDYLTHFLRQDYIRTAGERRMTGSGGQRRVPKSFLEELKIPLPPLEEQKRIAGILDQADALRRLRTAALDKLNTLGQAIFHEMFGDPSSNPKNWKIKTLPEIGTLDRGVSKHRPRNDPALLGGVHPLIQTGDVSRAGDYIIEYSATYSDMGLAQSRKWKKGTVCITIAANIADTAILDFDACFPDSVVGFDGGSEGVNFFIHRWFKTVKNKLEDIAPAVAQKNINLKILRELPVICPPTELIAEFYQKESELRQRNSSLIKHAEQTSALFASLQHRAFRGEL